MSHEVAKRAIDLMVQEVIPAIKEYKPDLEKRAARKATMREMAHGHHSSSHLH